MGKFFLIKKLKRNFSRLNLNLFFGKSSPPVNNNPLGLILSRYLMSFLLFLYKPKEFGIKIGYILESINVDNKF